MKKLIFFLFTISYFLFPLTTHAQAVSLSVSPPVVEIMLAPGKQVTQTFTLHSTGEEVSVTPQLHLAKPADENGHVTIDPNPLSPSSIPLTYKITGPNDNPTVTFEAASTDIAQDVYLALVFKTTSPESLSSNLTSTSPAISALILLTINPTGVLPISLDIKDFSPPIIHDSWSPLTINPTIENQVPIMIRPEGKYEIFSPTGKTLLSLDLYPNLVLGSSSRSIQSTIDHQPSTITWSPSWSNLGPHRLVLTLNTQGGTKLTQIEKIVWILPIRIMIMAFILVISLLTLIYKRTKFKTV